MKLPHMQLQLLAAQNGRNLEFHLSFCPKAEAQTNESPAL
jgi:hypothetical protein